MIDLTPLDVRKKRGDFGKALRGYDPAEVDGFLELVTERMEELVKENLAFRAEVEQLTEKAVVQEGREQAVQEALVTAQELREDVKQQAHREAKLLEREARGRVEGMILESEKLLTEHRSALHELERQRERFLKAFRTLLERELDTVEVEFGRAPLEDVTLDLELGKARLSIDDGDGEDEDEGQAQDAAASESEETPAAAVVADEPAVAESVSAQVEVATDDPAADGSVSPEVAVEDDESPSEEDGATEAVEGRPAEAQEGGGPLWLSSITSDQEEKDAE